MHLSNESLLVILLVGLVAGWLAGQIMRGYGFGLLCMPQRSFTRRLSSARNSGAMSGRASA